jgi:hypothetical protein
MAGLMSISNFSVIYFNNCCRERSKAMPNWHAGPLNIELSAWARLGSPWTMTSIVDKTRDRDRDSGNSIVQDGDGPRRGKTHHPKSFFLNSALQATDFSP